MSDPLETVYDDYDDLLADSEVRLEVSELHGSLCGVLCRGMTQDSPRWVELLELLIDKELPPADTLTKQLLALVEASAEGLERPDLSFALLVPPENEALAVRAEALGLWCRGFLSGYGMGGNPGDSAATDQEIAEVLQDFANISQVALDEDDSEENESSLLELHEYVRVAALGIYTQQAAEAAAAAAPSPAPAATAEDALSQVSDPDADLSSKRLFH